MKLVPPGGVPPIALWDHALDDPNLEDATIDHALSPLARIPGLARVEAAYRRRFRHKTWQYMTAVSDELFIAYIVGTAGFASNAFVYAVELATGAVHKRFAITPLSMHAHLAPSSTAGMHRFASKQLAISIANRGRDFDTTITADTGSRITAELAYTSAPADQHYSLCVPLAGNRWNYTHKFGAFGVTGHVEIDGRRFAMRDALGTLDFTKMYALRHAVWKWVAIAGRSRAGAIIGINLVDPTPLAPVSENCAWVDGAHVPLTGVHLESHAGAWRVRASGLDLAMTQIASVEQRLDVPLVRHRLGHTVGAFTGTLDVGRVRHELAGVVGIAEDNDTWW